MTGGESGVFTRTRLMAQDPHVPLPAAPWWNSPRPPGKASDRANGQTRTALAAWIRYFSRTSQLPQGRRGATVGPFRLERGGETRGGDGKRRAAAAGDNAPTKGDSMKHNQLKITALAAFAAAALTFAGCGRETRSGSTDTEYSSSSTASDTSSSGSMSGSASGSATGTGSATGSTSSTQADQSAQPSSGASSTNTNATGSSSTDQSTSQQQQQNRGSSNP